MAPPLRGDSPPDIYGLPDLSPKDIDRVRLGNKLANWVVSLIKLCLQHSIPIIIENPLTSRLWIYPPLMRLLPRSSSCGHFDHCQYGASWMKHTKLVAWNADISPLLLHCHSKQNLCSRTAAPHVPLSGVGPDKIFWTAKASAYPWPFCRALAKLIHEWCRPARKPP